MDKWDKLTQKIGKVSLENEQESLGKMERTDPKKIGSSDSENEKD